MAFYSTLGYKFKIPDGVKPAGSVLLCGALPMHQLQRRRPSNRGKARPAWPSHMSRLLFDPQLYLAGLDANQSRKQCAKLATYPWFGVASQFAAYDSSENTQREWMESAAARVSSVWPSRPPLEAAVIRIGSHECIDLQIDLGCEAIVLPSPLTHDPSSSYQTELQWVDEGVEYARGATQLPVYATVALADLCLRYTEPENNTLLDLIADAVSARGVDGIYLVVEQASEAAETRQCGNSRVLASVLHLTHLFIHDCRMAVAVNFLGAFGLVCKAVGASKWSSAWYKSLHRLRLADQGAEGRAYPSYWTYPGAFDVNLDKDFDLLVGAGMLGAISDATPASNGLLAAASRGVSSNAVAAWVYSQSNITTCTEHFFHSCIAADTQFAELSHALGVAEAEKWLENAVALAAKALSSLPQSSKTRVKHVSAWLEALRYYRRIHNV